MEKLRIREAKAHKKYATTFKGTATWLLATTKGRAKRKNLEFNLDKDWVVEHLSDLKCEATGLPLSLEKDDRYSASPFRPSIDKIDNTKGYKKDNCQITSVIYNKTKADSLPSDVLLMAQSLLEKSNG